MVVVVVVAGATALGVLDCDGGGAAAGAAAVVGAGGAAAGAGAGASAWTGGGAIGAGAGGGTGAGATATGGGGVQEAEMGVVSEVIFPRHDLNACRSTEWGGKAVGKTHAGFCDAIQHGRRVQAAIGSHALVSHVVGHHQDDVGALGPCYAHQNE